MKNLLSTFLQADVIETATTPIQTLINSLMVAIGEWAPKILGALLALIVGLWIVGKLTHLLRKGLDKSKFDETLKPFLTTVINFSLKVLLFIIIAGQIGVETTSFAAVLVGVSMAIGAAFNGSLGHMASGVMLLIFKPFKVGDLIESNGTLGFVREISVFVTILETFQNKTEIIPNGSITSNKITNYSTIGNLRIDMPFGIRYGADIEKAKEIALTVLQNDANVLKNPAPRIAVNNLGENGVELLALPYVTIDGYWDVYWDTRQKIVEELGKAGYEAPLPQRVVNIKNQA
ncbi:MAG: mechanosensitive ion channel family protein [Flavobacteriales bacterium]|nr:mechanosensitive ion channel family protein [Flavobacteriales bacterium]